MKRGITEMRAGSGQQTPAAQAKSAIRRPLRHDRAAVKVIDSRGNEVMRVHRLDGKAGYESEA